MVLTNASQFYFDPEALAQAPRFYRAMHTNPPVPPVGLGIQLIPAITLTGSVGSSVRMDYINRIGPIDAWVKLDTVILTTTSQLYHDVSALGQPPRLYRLVQVP